MSQWVNSPLEAEKAETFADHPKRQSEAIVRAKLILVKYASPKEWADPGPS